MTRMGIVRLGPAVLAGLLGSSGCCLSIVSGNTSGSTGTTAGTSAATSVGSGTGPITTGGSSTGALTTGGSSTGALTTGGSSTGTLTTGGSSSGGQTTGRMPCPAATVFAPFVSYPVGAQPFGIAAANLGNGKVGLAVSDDGEDMVWILRGPGNGTFDPAVGFPEGDSSYALTTADFNHDGLTDIAVANNGPGTVSVLYGQGDGGFGAVQTFPAGPGPNCVIAVDLDGDGELDLVVSNYWGGNGATVSVMLGQGDGGFNAPVPYTVGAGAIFVATADFNGDGIPDLLAAAQHANSLSLLLGVGDGTFSSAQAFGASAGNYPASIGVGNFNGSLGAAAADWGGNSVAVLAGPVTTTEQPAIINLGPDSSSNPNSVTVADFDGDGILDLAVAESSTTPGTIALLIGKGNGTFAPPVTFAVGPSSVTLVAADLNEDGKPDLAVADSSGSVSILLNACP